MFTQGPGFRNFATTGDPYFSNVSLLLNMGGANLSTTLTDSGPLGFTTTITGGNSVISTNQSRFTTTSLQIQTISHLSATYTNAAFRRISGEPWTVEFFAKRVTAPNNSVSPAYFKMQNQAGTNIFFMNGYGTNGSSQVGFGIGTANFAPITYSNPDASGWDYFGVVFSAANAVTVYANGVQFFTNPVGGAPNTDTTGTFFLGGIGIAPGAACDCYMGPLRVTKGVARNVTTYVI
jgi:hypothetical protein